MKTTIDPTVRLLDAHQAAHLIGIGKSTFHRQRSLNLIGPQPIRIGGSVRWDREELNRWIDAGCPDAARWKAIEEASRKQQLSTRLKHR